MSAKLIWAHIALFTVALIYAANYSIAKIVMDPGYIQPSGFILIRVLGGAAILTCIHYFFIKEKVEKKDHMRLALCGLTGAAVNMTFFFEGLHRTTPIHASLIMTMTPIIVLVLGAYMSKSAITIKQWLGVLLGFIGAAYLIIFSNQESGSSLALSDTLLGDGMILINATSYSIYLILVKKLMSKYQALTVIKWVFIYGLILVLPIGIKPLLQTQTQFMGTVEWMSVVYVVLCVTVMAYTLNAFAIKSVRPSVVSAYIYLQPLLATGIALQFRGDILKIEHILCGLLILLGVALVSIKSRAKTG